MAKKFWILFYEIFENKKLGIKGLMFFDIYFVALPDESARIVEK